MSHYNHYSKRMNEKHEKLMKGIETPEKFTKIGAKQQPANGVFEWVFESARVLEGPHSIGEGVKEL